MSIIRIVKMMMKMTRSMRMKRMIQRRRRVHSYRSLVPHHTITHQQSLQSRLPSMPLCMAANSAWLKEKTTQVFIMTPVFVSDVITYLLCGLWMILTLSICAVQNVDDICMWLAQQISSILACMFSPIFRNFTHSVTALESHKSLLVNG